VNFNPESKNGERTAEAVAFVALQADDRRGAYAEAAARGDGLPSELRRRPAIALLRTRIRMRQGRMNDASAALEEADHAAASAGERLLLALERASLRIYREVAIRAALDEAEAAFKLAEGVEIEGADRADAERVHVRVLITAAIYREISNEEALLAHNRLPDLASQLDRSGRIDEALAAHFTYADRIEDSDAKLAALTAFAELALTAGQPGRAAEAYVSRAEHLLASGAPALEIEACLARAEELFSAANHVFGPIDGQRVRARLAVEREFATLDGFDACLDAYLRIDFPKGAMSVLLDLSTLSHQRGRLNEAATYRRRCLEMAETCGMGLMRDSARSAQVDFLMRAADHAGAMAVCEAALADHLPDFARASYEQHLATANSFVGNMRAAREHAERALTAFMAVGAQESASLAVLTFATALAFNRRDSDSDDAEKRLVEWSDRDLSRDDLAAATQKSELLAQVHLNRFLYSPTRRGEMACVVAAERTIKAAEQHANRIPGAEGARRRGALHQLRGQIAQVRGESEEVESAWRAALAEYETARLEMEAANCRYIIGIGRLNRANENLLAHFGEAEANLRDALRYYDSAGMRERSAETRFMFALLYVNAAPRVTADLSAQMQAAALDHLTQAEADFDALRREFAMRPVLETQQAKRTFTERSWRIYNLALQILISQGNVSQTWLWCQRGKARALGDAMGASSAPPARILAEVEKHPDSYRLVLEERDLAVRTEKASAEARLSLRAELAALHAHMAGDRNLSEYLELRTGAALDPADLVSMFASAGLGDRDCLCVDWTVVNDSLVLIAVRPGEKPEIVQLPLTGSTVRAYVASHLSPAHFRHTLHDEPDLLRILDSLIAPLANLSRRDELLILIPAGPLHALPLHALEIESEPLLARNPVVYAPSLSVLRHCLARRARKSAPQTAALFGDPAGNLPAAAALVNELAIRFQTKPLNGSAVTRAAFSQLIAGCDIIHFQGHALHDRNEPLESYLEFYGGEKLTARDVFALRELRASLVLLAACESAASVVAPGDEPLGLIPAFLYAGADAVLATLWRVNSTSAAIAMRRFYQASDDGVGNKADALRRAALAVANTSEFKTPYHWAPFVLYGSWI
jgi:CHAT domain-containing protein